MSSIEKMLQPSESDILLQLEKFNTLSFLCLAFSDSTFSEGVEVPTPTATTTSTTTAGGEMMPTTAGKTLVDVDDWNLVGFHYETCRSQSEFLEIVEHEFSTSTSSENDSSGMSVLILRLVSTFMGVHREHTQKTNWSDLEDPKASERYLIRLRDFQAKYPPFSHREKPDAHFQPVCPDCGTKFDRPPPQWICPHCKQQSGKTVMTWESHEDPRCCVCKEELKGSVWYPFGKFKHHCRVCGFYVCSGCVCSGTVRIDGEEELKVCQPCGIIVDVEDDHYEWYH